MIRVQISWEMSSRTRQELQAELSETDRKKFDEEVFARTDSSLAILIEGYKRWKCNYPLLTDMRGR